MEPRPKNRNQKKKPKSALTPVQKQEVSKISRRMLDRTTETKFTLAGNSVSATLSNQVAAMVSIAQGTLDSNRIGDTIQLVSLHVKYQIDRNPANTVYNEYVRVIIFQWHANSVAFDPVAGAASTFFLNDPAAAAVNHRSHYGPDYLTRGATTARILYDVVHQLVGLGTATSPNHTNGVWVDRMINLNSARKSVQFIAASATNGTNNLYWMFIGTTATNPSTITYSSFLRFRDE